MNTLFYFITLSVASDVVNLVMTGLYETFFSKNSYIISRVDCRQITNFFHTLKNFFRLC